MTELRSSRPDVLLPAGITDDLQPAIADLVERVTTRVREGVAAYAGPPTGRRRNLIAMATAAAVRHFLDQAQGKRAPAHQVEDLFRRMGYGEATDGHDLSPLRTALYLAMREAWGQLRVLARDHGLSADELGLLGDALADYVDHLADLVGQGHAMGLRAAVRDTSRARRRLLDALLAGADDAVATEVATSGWTMPTELVVLAVSYHGELVVPELPGDPLVRLDSRPGVVVVDAGRADAVAERLRSASPGVRVALSWGVPPVQAPAAHRWATRALDLVDRGVIPPVPVVRCRDHATQLWLHAEPVVRQVLVQDLLQPLLAETPNSREILSETLLAWLESRDSAAAIAARLDVHPQTVRYRWKRVNELFGDLLNDPEFVGPATMLLKASVPLWKAGDQSDFERFRGQERRG